MPTNFWGKSALVGTTKGIFAYGGNAGNVSISNLVSNTGVVATDTAGVGTARFNPAGCSYGGDKGIFAYGLIGSTTTNISNKVSNTGVVAANTTGVGSSRYGLAGCEYGGDKGIFAYGSTATTASSRTNLSNLVSNTGVVAANTTGVGTPRWTPAGCRYGGDKGIFAYGSEGNTIYSLSNKVSNTGVVATDTAGVGTARLQLGACSYGGDKGIFAYGFNSTTLNISNKVSNTGVVAANTTGVGTARTGTAACSYGGDKGIFAYGASGLVYPGYFNMSNKVSNTGVVATDTAGVGTTRSLPGSCGYSTT
jgi:hypothetical protein